MRQNITEIVRGLFKSKPNKSWSICEVRDELLKLNKKGIIKLTNKNPYRTAYKIINNLSSEGYIKITYIEKYKFHTIF